MTFLSGQKLRASALNSAFNTWNVSTSAAGTGTGATQLKDASGDLTFTATSGNTYTLVYTASALGVTDAHYANVFIRDGGVSSPTSASPDIADMIVRCGGGTSLPVGFTLTKTLACPADLSAGVHKIAVFYSRNAAGATTNNIQLENAGPNRRLSVIASPTGT